MTIEESMFMSVHTFFLYFQYLLFLVYKIMRWHTCRYYISSVSCDPFNLCVCTRMIYDEKCCDFILWTVEVWHFVVFW